MLVVRQGENDTDWNQIWVMRRHVKDGCPAVLHSQRDLCEELEEVCGVLKIAH